MARPTPARVALRAKTIGENLTAWRKLQGLTAEQLAERAGMSRGTLRKIEQGDPGVSLEGFLSVASSLGLLDQIAKATDPYETDLGRARADEVLPQRVRR
ncbi:helix-turn-helix transcriptional regulator [Herbiconiux sp. 11R-BC]|uniref:helix-turn-helix domain-containing protein n=1 Tax=Herbiconiux sp. 11R-BC TaxID=3111637 RepID=UPI003BFEA658